MRRLIVISSALIFASMLVSLAALSVSAQTTSQQNAAEDATQHEIATPVQSSEALGTGAPVYDGSPSQGTYTEGRAGPNEPSLVDGTGPSTSESDDMVVAARGRASGNDVVRMARRYIGTKYRYATCTRSRMSCTCLTKKVFARFGHKLPMSEGGQWKHKHGARKVPKSKLRPGDIVFFKEAGRNRPITHIGIYSGKGNLVHASRYFGKVVESKMRYIDGYFGAKRQRLR
jgi:cell wall-associated NlpC family hydrolase